MRYNFTKKDDIGMSEVFFAGHKEYYEKKYIASAEAGVGVTVLSICYLAMMPGRRNVSQTDICEIL
jgi:hypothetical protein